MISLQLCILSSDLERNHSEEYIDAKLKKKKKKWGGKGTVTHHNSKKAVKLTIK